MAEAVAASVQAGQSDLDFFRPSKAFLDSPAGSFDKVVMERADNALVVPVSFGWRDVGSWRAIQDAVPADADGNLIRGDVMALDVANSLIHAQGRLIGAIGVRDLIIVETNDAVLVANRERTQQVGALAEQLKRLRRSEYLLHRQEFRPWGSWESLASGARFNVKQLRLKPGASTSLQRHQHRAEHWVVVGGVAEVVRDDETFTLTENSSIEIPQGAVHRLRNPGESPLEIIEIQIGAYLGEDDIVRFEDEYGRDALSIGGNLIPMPGSIPKAFIDELLNRTNIVEVINGRVSLKKAGKDFQGLCPFHDEKTPSFTVSPAKNMYYCFGCGAGGDAIKFVQQFDGGSFTEAVESLAAAAGMEGASATVAVAAAESAPAPRRHARRRALLQRAAQENAGSHRLPQEPRPDRRSRQRVRPRLRPERPGQPAAGDDRRRRAHQFKDAARSRFDLQQRPRPRIRPLSGAASCSQCATPRAAPSPSAAACSATAKAPST